MGTSGAFGDQTLNITVNTSKPTVKVSGAINSIHTNLNMAPGPDQIVVRAWDTSGAYGDPTIKVTVNKLTVIVSLPTQGETVGSPINVQAGPGNIQTQWMSKWRVYLDNVEVYAGAVGKIDRNIQASSAPATVRLEAAPFQVNLDLGFFSRPLGPLRDRILLYIRVNQFAMFVKLRLEGFLIFLAVRPVR